MTKLLFTFALLISFSAFAGGSFPNRCIQTVCKNELGCIMSSTRFACDPINSETSLACVDELTKSYQRIDARIIRHCSSIQTPLSLQAAIHIFRNQNSIAQADLVIQELGLITKPAQLECIELASRVDVPLQVDACLRNYL
jgi:hypothetical protein